MQNQYQHQQRNRRSRPDDGPAGDKGVGKAGKSGDRKEKTGAGSRVDDKNPSLPWDADEMDLWRHDGEEGAAEKNDGRAAVGLKAAGRGARTGDPNAKSPKGARGTDPDSGGRSTARGWSTQATAASRTAVSRGNNSDDEDYFSSSSEEGFLYWDARRRKDWAKAASLASKQQTRGSSRAEAGESDASYSAEGGALTLLPSRRHRRGKPDPPGVAKGVLPRRGGGRSQAGAVANVDASPSSSDAEDGDGGQIGKSGGGYSPSGVGGESPNEDDEEEDDHYSGRQHWMPDRLCRHCYACEAQFTVFRRRHHCRLCGQVFCSACSAYFVEVSDKGEPVALSAEDGMVGVGSGSGLEAVIEPSVAKGTDTVDGGGLSEVVTPRSTMGGSVRTMRACEMCYEQVLKTGVGGVGDTATNATIRPSPRRKNSSLLRGSSGSITETKGGAGKGGGGKAMQSDPAGDVTPKSMLRRQAGSDLLPLAPTSKEIDAAPSQISLGSLVTAPDGDKGGIAKSLAGYEGTGDPNADFHVLSLIKKKNDEERKKVEEAEMIRVAAEAALAAAAAISSDTAPSKAAAKALGAASIEGAKYKAAAHSDVKQSGEANPTTERRLGRSISSRFGRRFAGRIGRAGTVSSDGADKTEVKDEDVERKAEQNGKGADVGDTTDDEAFSHLPSSSAPAANKGSLTAAAATIAKAAVGSGTAGNSGEKANSDPIKSENRRLGFAAADHLEKMGKELLESDAPLLLEEVKVGQNHNGPTMNMWVDTLMMLATRCCATVRPNVKKGDMLDIRPYCRVKGKLRDIIDCLHEYIIVMLHFFQSDVSLVSYTFSSDKFWWRPA